MNTKNEMFMVHPSKVLKGDTIMVGSDRRQVLEDAVKVVIDNFGNDLIQYYIYHNDNDPMVFGSDQSNVIAVWR